MATAEEDLKKKRRPKRIQSTKVDEFVELGKKTIDAARPEVQAARRQLGAFGQLIRENAPTRREAERATGRAVRGTVDAPDTARALADRGRIEARGSLRRVLEDADLSPAQREAAAFNPGAQDYRAATGSLRRRSTPPPNVSADPPAPVQRGVRLAPAPDASNVGSVDPAPRAAASVGGATVGPDPVRRIEAQRTPISNLDEEIYQRRRAEIVAARDAARAQNEAARIGPTAQPAAVVEPETPETRPRSTLQNAGDRARAGLGRLQAGAQRIPGYDAVNRAARTAVDRSAATLEAYRNRTGVSPGAPATPDPTPTSDVPEQGARQAQTGGIRNTLRRATGRNGTPRPDTGPGALRRGARLAAGAVRGGIQGLALEGGITAGERVRAANATPESINQELTNPDALGSIEQGVLNVADAGRRALGGTGTAGTEGAAPNEIASEEGRAAGIASLRRQASSTNDPTERLRLTMQADRAEQSGVVGEDLRRINRDAGPQLMVRAMENFPAVRRGIFAAGDLANRVLPDSMQIDVAGARAVSPEGQSTTSAPSSRLRPNTSPSAAAPAPVVARANTSGQPSVADADPDIQGIVSRIQAGGNVAPMPQNTGFIRNERTGETRTIDQRGGTTRITGQAAAPANIPTSFRRSLGTPTRISRQSAGGATLPRISRNNFAAAGILAGTNQMIRNEERRAAGQTAGTLSKGQQRFADTALKARKQLLDETKFDSEIGKQDFDRLTSDNPSVRQAGFADITQRVAQGDPNARQAARAAMGTRLLELAPSYVTAGLFGGQGPIDAITNFFRGKGDITKVRIDEATGEIVAPRANGTTAILGKTGDLEPMERTLLRHLIAQGQ